MENLTSIWAEIVTNVLFLAMALYLVLTRRGLRVVEIAILAWVAFGCILETLVKGYYFFAVVEVNPSMMLFAEVVGLTASGGFTLYLLYLLRDRIRSKTHNE